MKKRWGRILMLALGLCMMTACGTEKKNAEEGGTVQSVATTDREQAVVGTEQKKDEAASEKKEEPVQATTTVKEEPATTAAVVKEPLLTPSGKAEDMIEVKENSYYEGEKYVMYFHKGAKVPGNIAVKTEEIMKELEELYGMTYGDHGYRNPGAWREEYFGGGYDGLNPDHAKLDILIVPDMNDGEIEWADRGVVMLFDADYDEENTGYKTVSHELSHLLRMDQSLFLGQIIEEGVGVYSEDKFSRKAGYPNWDLIQYVNTHGFGEVYDASPMEKDAEKTFREVNVQERSAEQAHYHYGVRLVTFLQETYGQDAAKRLSETARKYTFGEKDNDTIVKILKETFGEDVFKKFEEWLPKGWGRWCDEYLEYMKPYGLEY